MVKPGDQVRVRVVGLGAYRRKWHDALATVLEVNPKQRSAKVLFKDEERVFSFDVIEKVVQDEE
jgi:hypothetical protein